MFNDNDILVLAGTTLRLDNIRITIATGTNDNMHKSMMSQHDSIISMVGW